MELTAENFDQIIKSNPTVVVDWWAPWCGPCRAFAPVFERVTKKHPEVTFGKINTDENQELSARFGINAIPTLMIFKDGKIVLNQPGMLPENVLDGLIEQAKPAASDA